MHYSSIVLKSARGSAVLAADSAERETKAVAGWRGRTDILNGTDRDTANCWELY